MKHKLLIDCSFMREDYQSTIDIYASRLLQGFRNNAYFDVMALVPKGCEGIVDNLSGYEVPKIVFEKNLSVTPWIDLDRLLGLNPLIKKVSEYGIETILEPCHLECRFFFPKRFHQHAVVHDLIQNSVIKKMMKGYKFFVWNLFHKILLKKIPYFISISEKTREEFKLIYGKDSVVVYNSIPVDVSIQEEKIEGIGNGKYILDVNRLQSYKNAETLVRAFSLIKDKIPHYLYLKGTTTHGEKYGEYLKKLVRDLGISERVVFDHSFRNKGQMRYLYSHADLFVSPSLMEGFGWTPIEAAVFGVPTLLSNIDVFREITCGRIPMFDPHSPEELAGKMLEVLSNPPGKASLKEISDFYLEYFSMERQIKRMTEVLLESHKDN